MARWILRQLTAYAVSYNVQSFLLVERSIKRELQAVAGGVSRQKWHVGFCGNGPRAHARGYSYAARRRCLRSFRRSDLLSFLAGCDSDSSNS